MWAHYSNHIDLTNNIYVKENARSNMKTPKNMEAVENEVILKWLASLCDEHAGLLFIISWP